MRRNRIVVSDVHAFLGCFMELSQTLFLNDEAIPVLVDATDVVRVEFLVPHVLPNVCDLDAPDALNVFHCMRLHWPIETSCILWARIF